MNHKRNRPKQSRAGCLLCKPNKLGKGMENKFGHRGFGKLRDEAAAKQDLIDAKFPAKLSAIHSQSRQRNRVLERQSATKESPWESFTPA